MRNPTLSAARRMTAGSLGETVAGSGKTSRYTARYRTAGGKAQRTTNRRIAEIVIPTVYGEEQSQIRTFRDVPRIVGTLGRLTLEGVFPPLVMRAAARARAGAASR